MEEWIEEKGESKTTAYNFLTTRLDGQIAPRYAFNPKRLYNQFNINTTKKAGIKLATFRSSRTNTFSANAMSNAPPTALI